MNLTFFAVILTGVVTQSANGSEQHSKLHKGSDGQMELVVRAKRRAPASIPKNQAMDLKTKEIPCDLGEIKTKNSSHTSGSSGLPFGTCRIEPNPKTDQKK
jgi:hypothetical protein